MRDSKPRLPWIGLLVSVLLLVALVIFTLDHIGDASRFARLLERAQPWWVAVALALQFATYICAGAIWRIVVEAAGHRLRLLDLARLAIEKLSVDQLMPSGGISGNLVVAGALRRLGVPSATAVEALIIDILAYYAVYALAAAIAFSILWSHHEVTRFVSSLLAVFSLVVATVPATIAWLIRHREWRPGPKLARLRFVVRVHETVASVSPKRIRNPRLLASAAAFSFAIFVLDATTLWALLRATGTTVPFTSAFAALVVASMAGTISFLPGGIGTFEAGCTLTLRLLGVPLEAALTGTLLLRGLTLWLPLLPGGLLARRDLAELRASVGKHAKPDEAAEAEQNAYWADPVAAVLERLRSSPSGLDRAQAEARLQTFGPNRLILHRGGPLRAALLAQLRSPLVWLLLFAATIGALVGEVTTSIIVLAILAIGSLISIVQESRSGRALERLRERVALRARVLRSGRELEVLASEVVPGDVLLLTAGTMIAADAVLLEARDLFVIEAALTGEAFAVEKLPGAVPQAAPLAARANVVHMGTNVLSGAARAVAVNTGARTAFGHVALRLASKAPETEFHRGLRHFGYLMVRLMVILVLLVFAASVLQHHPLTDALLFAIALAVGLVPEMLPAVLATMLARGASRMAERGVLVRRLEAIENLGNMSVLCTDKTGTLTEGEIELQASTDPTGVSSARVARLACWNAGLQEGLPNPLDRALVSACGEIELPTKLDELPFDFTRKRLSVLVSLPGEQPLLISKGAAEPMMAACEFVRVDESTVVALDPELRARLASQVDAWSRQGVRAIAVATRIWPRDTALRHEDERELVFEGFATFRDPPKADAQRALRELSALGVRVIVISGDHRAVVAHLAEQVAMPRNEVVRGAEIEALPDDALRHTVERVDLFAEVDPIQKERLVLALVKAGHVVGFMGDGINDAPAIHAADVGISVDSAADVAREAADFVLLRPELGALRDGVKEGRATFANTTKYVQITESANLGNMISMAAAALFLPFLPLLAPQILLNNLLADVPSTMLAGDRVDDETMLRPQQWDVTSLRWFMVYFGLLSSAFDGLTFVVLIAVFDVSPEQFRTAWFVESLLTQLLVLLVLRTRRRLWKSRPHAALLAAVLAMIALAFALPMSPLRRVLEFVDVPAPIWLSVVGIALTYVVVVELVKQPLLRHLDRIAAKRREPARWRLRTAAEHPRPPS